MTTGEDSVFERGAAMRRLVLDDAHVDRAMEPGVHVRGAVDNGCSRDGRQ